MFLKDYLDVDRLTWLVNNDYVEKVKHENGMLAVYNYTHKTTYENLWDGVTNKVRGLIVEEHSGLIVARPREKFFNLNTKGLPETDPKNFPEWEPEITDKLDGVMGTAYRWNGKWAVATRGRFHSPLAKYASNKLGQDTEWPDRHTPCFEIIWANHPIICKYDFNDIVLTGLVNVDTGEEVDYKELSGWAEHNKLRVVEKIDLKVNEALVAADTQKFPNKEGWVFSWNLGAQPPLKVKVKFDDYVQAASIAKKLSRNKIYEMLQAQYDFRLIYEYLPEHLRAKVSKERMKIIMHRNFLLAKARTIVSELKTKTRRDVAKVFEQHPDVKSLCWVIFDGKDPQEQALKLARPTIDDQMLEVWL